MIRAQPDAALLDTFGVEAEADIVNIKSLRSRFLGLAMAGVCGFELFAATGCVEFTPNGSEAVVFPPGPPEINVGFYGRPAGYYYRDYPVYMYGNRHVYYYNGRRYWYHRGPHYYYRNGYRHYY